MDEIDRAHELLKQLAPNGRDFVLRDPLEVDECRWLLRAVGAGLASFQSCDPRCPRLKKWGVAGPDEFVTPAGAFRHLFSSPASPVAWLNREYIPHIAAYARAVLDLGYDSSQSSLSLYRRFTKDLINKKQGVSYETDAEFYDADGSIYLHIEAKKDAVQVARIAKQLVGASSFSDLPANTAKEIEYVLDLQPKFLWLVGPGSIDPAPHIYAVTTSGLNATFEQLTAVPRPPSRQL